MSISFTALLSHQCNISRRDPSCHITFRPPSTSLCTAETDSAGEENAGGLAPFGVPSHRVLSGHVARVWCVQSTYPLLKTRRPLTSPVERGLIRCVLSALTLEGSLHIKEIDIV